MGIEDRIYTGLKHYFSINVTFISHIMGIEDRIYTGLKHFVVTSKQSIPDHGN